MHSLDLDFHRAPPISPWSWVLFGAGLLTLGWLALAHYQIAEQTKRNQATLAGLESRNPARAAPSASDVVEQATTLAKAKQAIAKNRHPWGDLFATLEKADNKDVALLAFTPDAAKGQIRIQAEARNLSAMLAYQRRLEGGSLRQVALIEHDIAAEASGSPVRFQLMANWGTDHARP